MTEQYVNRWVSRAARDEIERLIEGLDSTIDVDQDAAVDDGPCDEDTDAESSVGSFDRMSNQIKAWDHRDGAEVPPPPARAARKPRMTPADREATAIAAADTIECLLPAYVELYRAWAKGAVAAGAYRDANTSEAYRYREGGPVEAAVKAIRETTGANAAQRAKTLAAMWSACRGLPVTSVSISGMPRRCWKCFSAPTSAPPACRNWRPPWKAVWGRAKHERVAALAGQRRRMCR